MWPLAGLLLAGCADPGGSHGTSVAAPAPDATYLLVEAPDDVMEVAAARAAAQDQQQVTLVGHIGGSAEPFVSGVAAFTLVDTSLKWCPEEEGCPTPWDYCCDPGAVRDNLALVKIVDQAGLPVQRDARTLLGVKELSKVIVRGKVARDEHGNFTLLAEKVYLPGP
ncbi:MAG: hypothetical protein J5I93_30760 [Pirellulaceae bacterium]|nr:hypothetical protein [Pirellulaceae bacterium]